MSCVMAANRVQVTATLSWFLILVLTKSIIITTTAYPSLSPSTKTTKPRQQRPFHQRLQASSSSSLSSLSPGDYADFGSIFTGKDNSRKASSTATATARAFDAAVRNRFACKAFLRFDQRQATATAAARAFESNATATTTTATNTTVTATAAIASISDPSIVARAVECLEIARLSPSAFNTQVRPRV
jgi:hypothetical protein